jgi:hypothetical protein
MLHFLIEFTVPRLGLWFWNEGKDILDTTPLDSIYSLNHRHGSNASKGCGHRRQPDPNPGSYRKYSGSQQPFMNMN